MNRIHRFGFVVVSLVALVVSLVPGGCGSSNPGPAYTPDLAAHERHSLDAVEARLVRLLDSVEAASEAAPESWNGRSCRERRRARARASALRATPDECTIHETQAETRDALRTVQHALAKDLFPLVARLHRLSRDERYGEYQWLTITRPVLESTVDHVEWMVDALEQSHELTEGADLGRDNQHVWRAAGQHYEAALVGAQVLSVWMSWLDFAKALHARTTLGVEVIMVHLVDAWRDVEPVLALARMSAIMGSPDRTRAALEALMLERPRWTQALSDWGEEVRDQLREGDELVDTLMLIQAGVEILSMVRLASPIVGGGAARARSFAFLLPGIGNIMAGGVATGVRVVVSAEWLASIRHLIAIGAISSVEIVKLAGVAASDVPTPTPGPPTMLQRVDQSGGTAGGGTAGGGTGTGPARVVMQHRAGNRQVEVNGQRWHVPKGKSAADIPATDPVGDRLQATVDRIAGKWSPAELSPGEAKAIEKARAAGEPWRAKLLERQARGRWVEGQVSESFKEVQWSRLGVDAVDPGTGLRYEVLSGTKYNLDLHAKRMADELFRMITF